MKPGSCGAQHSEDSYGTGEWKTGKLSMALPLYSCAATLLNPAAERPVMPTISVPWNMPSGVAGSTFSFSYDHT